MLVIRKQQIQNFIARDEAELVDVVRGAIRRASRSRVAAFDDDELRGMVRIGIERARSHGLAGVEDLAAFVAIMFEIAPRFDEQKDIREILQDTTFPIETRMEHIFTCLDEAPWIEAQKKYDDCFWFPGEE